MNTRISSLLIAAITSAARTHAFTVIPSSRIVAVSAFRTTQASLFSSTKQALYAAVPEPGSCPECSDENGYWDGSSNFVCIACGHEWPVETSQGEDVETVDDGIVRDSNGNILETGDTVVLTKELGKGLKKGLKITRIRVGDYGNGHDCQATIPGLGTYDLKSQFLKKTS
jgi:protein PhnA